LVGALSNTFSSSSTRSSSRSRTKGCVVSMMNAARLLK
jgi:hypothetical protein